MTRPPVVWTVAGSDSGGGAGLQADLKAFDAFGVHGCTAISAITAQNSLGVQAIAPVDAGVLATQLDALAADLPPAAIKVGMLGSVAALQVLVERIDRWRAARPTLPLVVDPVLRATTGAGFADPALLQAYRAHLLPRTTLLTPNRSEAAVLLGLPDLRSEAGVEAAGQALREAGVQSVAITGGDSGGASSADWVDTAQARGWLRLPRVDTPHHHGTGCVFAASAAAAVAHGFVDAEAVVLAKMATTHALRGAYAAGAGAGPVRPAAGFALHPGNLPTLSLPGARRDRTDFPLLRQPDLGLYAIVDSAAWVRRVLAAGVRTVQLRIKEVAYPGLREEVRASIAAARACDAQLFINDHWQLALDEGAFGVHLGQEDLATADLEALARAGVRLGISTHAYWEVCRAVAVRPSYIACGPIHPTAAKAMPWLPQGEGNLAYWCQLLTQPVVAIAGMDATRAAGARACGAAGVAVISGITEAVDPEAAARALLRASSTTGRNTAVPAWARSTLARA